MISFFLLYYEKGQFIPDFHYIFNRLRKISSTYSICDSVQLTVKPFAVLTRQMSTCASTVSACRVYHTKNTHDKNHGCQLFSYSVTYGIKARCLALLIATVKAL